MQVPRFIIAALPFILCSTASLRADTIVLKSGEKVEGKILSETDTEVTVSLQVTATIKDERVIGRGEIETIEKADPGEEAWASLAAVAPGTESLERDEYTRVITALQQFVKSFPKNAHATLVKERLDQFFDEEKRVYAGEVKLDGKWLSKDQVREERVQVGGRILLNRMKRAAGAGQLTDAMIIFDQLEKGFAGAVSYPDAVELARNILASLKVAVGQAEAQFKRRTEDQKHRLATSKGAEHAELESLIKQEKARADFIIAATEHSGVKWYPLQPATERSLQALTSRTASEAQRLNGLNTDKMHESVEATEKADAKLSLGKFDDADKALQDATAAWSANELAKRLRVKLTEAKKASATIKTPTPAPTPTPKPKSTTSSVPATPAVPPVTDATDSEEKPFFKKPIFFVALAVLVAFGAIGGKMLAKARVTDDDVPE